MAQAAEAFETIAAKNDLRAKVKEIRSRGPGDDPVARAEAAINVLSAHFDDWMAREIEEIAGAHAAWAVTDYDAPEPREAFFRAVHDLKGQATTLGFPLASKVAASLTAILEGVPDRENLPVALIDQHVSAIRAIFREKAKDEGDQIGAELAETLARLAGDHLAVHGTEPPLDDFE